MKLGDEVEINYRSYQLDSKASADARQNTVERLMAKYDISKEDAEKKVEEISTIGRECGVEFNYKTAQFCNTYDAHRLMKFAEAEYERSIVESLNNKLFDAYFTENLLLSDHNVLRKIAIESGIEPEAAELLLGSGRYGDDVKFDEYEAKKRGVRGVPYFVFGNLFSVPGALTTEGFKTALLHAINKEKETLKNPNDPRVCDKNGCHIERM